MHSKKDAEKPKFAEPELHPDAWERFRSAVHVMTKAGPQHREQKQKIGKPRAKPKLRG
jgi:hypothetical protein